MKLKVVSWNIWYGQYLEEVVSFLKNSDADIICLQEILQEKDGKNNTAEIIAKELNLKSVCGFAIEKEKDGKILDWGNAILSKYSIIDSDVHELSIADRRIALEARIKIENDIFNVFTTHLIHTHQKDSEIQNLQADNLVKNLTKARTILTGDFNATQESYSVKAVNKVLTNTDNSNLPTWSVYPYGCVVCKPKGLEHRLDYIFASDDLRVVDFKIGDSKGSDHLPITANFSF